MPKSSGLQLRTADDKGSCSYEKALPLHQGLHPAIKAMNLGEHAQIACKCWSWLPAITILWAHGCIPCSKTSGSG
jgi:hypothetical protein